MKDGLRLVEVAGHAGILRAVAAGEHGHAGPGLGNGSRGHPAGRRVLGPVAQPAPGLVDRGGSECQPLGEMASSGVGGEANVGQVLPGMLGQVSGEADRQVLQGLRTLGREGQQVQGTLAGNLAITRARREIMYVRLSSLTAGPVRPSKLTAGPVRLESLTYSRAGVILGLAAAATPAGCGASSRITWALVPPMPSELTAARRGVAAGGPVAPALGVHEEGGLRKGDRRVGAAEMEARRQRAVFQGQGRLDQAGDARRRFQVAEVGLHRADGAELLASGCRRKALVSAMISTGSPIAVPVPWAST